MKKLMLITLSILTLGTFTASADTDRAITVEQLPQKSQQFIKQYFPNEKVAYAKEERDFLETKYEVVFVNSAKLEFQKNGEWKDVDCVKGTAVPSALIPAKITGHIEKEFSGKTIRSISRDKKEYELELSDGMEVKYDLNGNFIGVD